MRVIAGGKRVGDKGYFIEPTVFADVKVRCLRSSVECHSHACISIAELRQQAAGCCVSMTWCHSWCPRLQDDMKIAMEEIFGPVQVILKYKTIDEVLH